MTISAAAAAAAVAAVAADTAATAVNNADDDGESDYGNSCGADAVDKDDDYGGSGTAAAEVDGGDDHDNDSHCVDDKLSLTADLAARCHSTWEGWLLLEEGSASHSPPTSPPSTSVASSSVSPAWLSLSME